MRREEVEKVSRELEELLDMQEDIGRRTRGTQEPIPEQIRTKTPGTEELEKAQEEYARLKEEADRETDLTEEEIEAFEAEWNARIQSINTEGIPEEYMERYRPAVERYRELGGKWGLDYKQTVFGQIVDGMNVAQAITQVKVNAADRSPKKEICIESIDILETLGEGE